MLRISKLSDYAIVLLTAMAEQDAAIVNAGSLARATGLARPTVTKLLKVLAFHGMLVSIQGRNGGYRLAVPPGDISMQQIIEAVDGPIAITECNQATGDCTIEQSCQSRRHWRRINQAVRQALADVKLSQLIHPEPEVEILQPSINTRS